MAMAVLFLLMLFPVKLTVVPNSRIYEGYPATKNNVKVYVSSLLGIKSELDSETYEMKTHSYGDVDVIRASYLYMKGTVKTPVVTVKKISASYNAKVYTGDRFSRLNIYCTTEYADGRKEDTQDFTVKNAPEVFVGVRENITIDTKNGPAVMTVVPIRLIDIGINHEGDLYQYDVPEFSAIKFTYADGSSKLIGRDDVTFSSDPGQPLEKLGEQKLVFTYDGLPYAASLTVKKNTNITNAVRENKEEIKNADYFYLSDSLYVAINRFNNGLGYYYLSHIVVNDPSQIVSALSYDTWGGKREKPSSAASRLDMIVAANGSYFSYDTNTPRCAEVFIKHGKVYTSADDDGEGESTTDGKELCLLKDGTLWTPEKGLTAKDLLNRGVTDIWGAGDPLLIQDGKLYPTEHQWVNGKYPRTGIGMIKPCEYYLLTAGSGGYKGGLTFDDVQNIFKKLGCQYARTLDGGGSSTLVFNDGDGAQVINNPAGKAERPVTDFIGFRN